MAKETAFEKLLKREEFGLHDEYDKMKEAIKLIGDLRSIVKKLRRKQKKFSMNFPDKEKTASIELYNKGVGIFGKLLNLEINKITPEIESTFVFFKKDIDFLKKQGFIRFPQI